jgi:hypothetical protein
MFLGTTLLIAIDGLQGGCFYSPHSMDGSTQKNAVIFFLFVQEVDYAQIGVEQRYNNLVRLCGKEFQ